MTELYLGLPLWYWILMGIGVIFVIIMGVLEEFRRYDIFVGKDFYRECRYERHPFFKEIEIWSSDNSLYIVTKYNDFALVNSYWKFKKPSEEFYKEMEKLQEELDDVE